MKLFKNQSITLPLMLTLLFPLMVFAGNNYDDAAKEERAAKKRVQIQIERDRSLQVSEKNTLICFQSAVNSPYSTAFQIVGSDVQNPLKTYAKVNSLKKGQPSQYDIEGKLKRDYGYKSRNVTKYGSYVQYELQQEGARPHNLLIPRNAFETSEPFTSYIRIRSTQKISPEKQKDIYHGEYESQCRNLHLVKKEDCSEALTLISSYCYHIQEGAPESQKGCSETLMENIKSTCNSTVGGQ